MLLKESVLYFREEQGVIGISGPGLREAGAAFFLPHRPDG